MAQTEPNLSRQTRYARALRAKLIVQLGGQCKNCGCDDPDELEFDHIHGVQYQHNRLSYSARMKRYEREAALDQLRLLCGPCNRAERKKNDNGEFIATRHHSLVPLTKEMPF
jgi:5-methylcytosine-specific restriction endonuclease McrA